MEMGKRCMSTIARPVMAAAADGVSELFQCWRTSFGARRRSDDPYPVLLEGTQSAATAAIFRHGDARFWLENERFADAAVLTYVRNS